jgi:glycosyltransferase involved in cell wall biosynthesis
MLKCFEHQDYPKDRMEWIIVDDGTDKIGDLVAQHPLVKYFPIEKKLLLGQKRNFMHEKTRGDILVYMDDDDYYPPESVLARVKLLLKYKDKGIECLGSTLIGTYNILTNTSSMSSDGPISLSEASMAYTKHFWEKRGFDELCVRGEHKYFTEQRLHQILDVPYSFILIAMCHRTNITDGLRNNGSTLKYTENNEVANFFDTWDEETQMFIMDLHHYLVRMK